MPAAVVVERSHSFEVDLDAKPRAFGRRDHAVDQLERLFEQVGTEVAHQLLGQDVVADAVNLEAGGERNRPERVVRGDLGVMSVRHSGDFGQLAYAARVADVGLVDVSDARFDSFPETPACKEPFARRDR